MVYHPILEREVAEVRIDTKAIVVGVGEETDKN